MAKTFHAGRSSVGVKAGVVRARCSGRDLQPALVGSRERLCRAGDQSWAEGRAAAAAGSARLTPETLGRAVGITVLGAALSHGILLGTRLASKRASVFPGGMI